MAAFLEMPPQISLAAWLAHATARGETAPAAASVRDQEVALQRAQDYVRHVYVRHFLTCLDQAAVADDVAEAVYLAATLEVATPGLFTQTYAPGDQKTLTKVGDLEWTPIASPTAASGSGAPIPVQVRSTAIESLLSPYMPGQGVGALLI